jgi:hypothetical protein
MCTMLHVLYATCSSCKTHLSMSVRIRPICTCTSQAHRASPGSRSGCGACLARPAAGLAAAVPAPQRCLQAPLEICWQRATVYRPDPVHPNIHPRAALGPNHCSRRRKQQRILGVNGGATRTDSRCCSRYAAHCSPRREECCSVGAVFRRLGCAQQAVLRRWIPPVAGPVSGRRPEQRLLCPVWLVELLLMESMEMRDACKCSIEL